MQSLLKVHPLKMKMPISVQKILYSTVRYASVSDPRTGEILESDIIWYHNHLRSYNNNWKVLIRQHLKHQRKKLLMKFS